MAALGLSAAVAAPAAAATSPFSNAFGVVAAAVQPAGNGSEVGPVIPNDDNAPGAQAAPNTLLPAGSAIHPAGAAPPKATGTPETFRVYATREGLVGHTTANGHKIVPNDRFVSLPDWHALSPKGKNYYSVRVCAALTKRCVYDPVWDVGPWNTADGYWNIHRTSWTKLPRGLPESQAAYQNGYNGGKDQFGRKVLNPAGIDLADGTIGSSGLGLGGSGWVTVTYLWTGGGVRGQVSTNGGSLNVRSGPDTGHKIVGSAGPYAKLPIVCSVKGQSITRSTRTSTWYRVATGNYVSAAYVTVKSTAKIKSC